jgi:two-component system sensor histidine kinase KdpD
MRGKLRIYLGAAPGVGKTYAMLDEGWRRRGRGTDVVIGLVVTHDRAKTIAQIRDLEIVAPKQVEHRGTVWEELDVEAILARRPDVVLVDELAHSNAGCKNEKRWQDIEELLLAGIEVISTLNIQHLESVNDVVNQITGVIQRETVPDSIVRRADQIELVDMSPEALRRRLAHGNVYKPEKIDAALGNYFRVGNLAALRELALLWVADRVEDSLQEYMAQHGISGTWETRERVLVALTGAPGGDHLVRRASRMARRAQGDLLGVHVVGDAGLTRPSPELLERHRALLEELGGTSHEVAGSDVASALVGFAAAHRATQLVLGTSRRSRWAEIARGSVINRVIRDAHGIDVHVISTSKTSGTDRHARTRPMLRSAYHRKRIVAGFAVAVIAVLSLAAMIARGSSLQPHHPGPLTSSAGLLMYLAAVVVVAAIGGRMPALLTAVAAVLVVDWYLIPPYGSFAIAHGSDVAYLGAFLVSAGAVSIVVEQAARRRVEALRSRDEADAVLALTDRLARPNPPSVVVEEIHEALACRSVALLSPYGDGWTVECAAGEPGVSRPEDGQRFDLRNGDVVVITGRALRADEHRLVGALLRYLEAVMTIHHLRSQASTVADLSQANDMRAALLAAVSHDLRTPLASTKALTTGWLEPDVEWSYSDTREFMRSIDTETDRLNKLVENLLDMSRLQTGALSLCQAWVGLDEIVPAALASLSERSHEIVVDVPETLPRLNVDATLVERAVANIVDNALRHSRRDGTVRIEAGEVAGRVDLRIVDRGTGIPLAQREQLFQPFQRLGDTDTGNGVGLGLAVSKGFVEAVGGELSVEDTPGGGITMVLSFPIAADGSATPASIAGSEPSRVVARR